MSRMMFGLAEPPVRIPSARSAATMGPNRLTEIYAHQAAGSLASKPLAEHILFRVHPKSLKHALKGALLQLPVRLHQRQP